MPARRFTKKANTPKKARQWQHVYDSVRRHGGSRGAAIKQANGVVKRAGRRSR